MKLFCCLIAPLLLLGCATSNMPTAARVSERSAPPIQDETPGSDGPKLVFIMREPREPSIYRVVGEARTQAVKDGTHLYSASAGDPMMFTQAIDFATRLPADGIVLVSPQKGDAELLAQRGVSKHAKILALEDRLTAANPQPFHSIALVGDYRTAGHMAASHMLLEAAHRGWKMNSVGAILFSTKAHWSSDDAVDAEAGDLIRGGVPARYLHRVVLSRQTLAEARTAAAKIMRNAKDDVAFWLIGGDSDLTVVGGVRACDDVGIGLLRAVGIGIGGDGALYDLQSARQTSFRGSMLFPLDQMSAKAEHLLRQWVVDQVPPIDYNRYRAVFLDRENVRMLKAENHLVD